jgi:DNA polymerase (family 10)
MRSRLTKSGGLEVSEKKTEENLAKAVEQYEKGYDWMSLGKALPLAEEIISSLKIRCES